jgi:hypothetical protein
MGLFSKGTMELQMDRLSFKPGESIEGTVRIKLKKPKQGKELSVTFIGKKEEKFVTTSGVMSAQKGAGSQTKYSTIHKFKVPVAGEQEYSDGEFFFSIPIPADILDAHEGPRMSEDAQTGVAVLKAVAGGTTQTGSKLKWKIKAELDLPGLDMKKSQDIVVMR